MANEGNQQPLWWIKLRLRTWRAFVLFVSDLPRVVIRAILVAAISAVAGARMTGAPDLAHAPQTITFVAAAVAIAIVLVWDAVAAFVRALSEEAKDGNWRDRTFTFHDKIVFSVTVTSADNRNPIPFKVKQGDWGASVFLTTQTEGRDAVYCRIQSSPDHPFPMPPGGYAEMWGMLRRHRTFWLVTEMAPTSNAATVHVKLMRWHASTPWHRRKLDDMIDKAEV